MARLLASEGRAQWKAPALVRKEAAAAVGLAPEQQAWLALGLVRAGVLRWGEGGEREARERALMAKSLHKTPVGLPGIAKTV